MYFLHFVFPKRPPEIFVCRKRSMSPIFADLNTQPLLFPSNPSLYFNSSNVVQVFQLFTKFSDTHVFRNSNKICPNSTTATTHHPSPVLQDDLLWTADSVPSIVMLLVLYIAMFVVCQIVIDFGMTTVAFIYIRLRHFTQRSSVNYSEVPPLLQVRQTGFAPTYRSSSSTGQREQDVDSILCSLDENSFDSVVLQQQQICVICLEPLDNDKRNVVATKCQHAHLLHRSCLRSWLIYNEALSCPICRNPISSSLR